ncbi:C-type lectin domain family 2 member B-like [Carettochelys insculpta]|uniref:C-type lectin domain family 2 member B-like n=1 Tax=Carettochelys insculpta TaxID=44489 RepID=UPI003EBA280E
MFAPNSSSCPEAIARSARQQGGQPPAPSSPELGSRGSVAGFNLGPERRVSDPAGPSEGQERSTVVELPPLSACSSESAASGAANPPREPGEADAWLSPQAWNTKGRKFCSPSVILGLLSVCLSIALVYKCASTQEISYCPKKWMGYEKKCYYFSDDPRFWNDSNEFCLASGATLGVIKNKQELEIINRYKENYYYWIGLSKGTAGWRWVDGSPFTDDILTLENEDANLNCAYLNTEKIVTVHCESLRRWICIKDLH